MTPKHEPLHLEMAPYVHVTNIYYLIICSDTLITQNVMVVNLFLLNTLVFVLSHSLLQDLCYLIQHL